MEVAIVFGQPPSGYGSGYGEGTGYGYGYGYSYGSGYGAGYGSGYGYGNSDGSGYGSGDGYGPSNGYGAGDGYGYGNGYGDGYGHGSGDGYGYGYGSSYGDGAGYSYGSSYGDGSSYGSSEYWDSAVSTFATKWPIAQRERLAFLQDSGVQIAYWRSNEAGRACNGGDNDSVKPGTVEESTGPLSLCKAGTLHATLIPTKWLGERWWIVALHGEVVGDNEKLGALKREIIGECLQ